MAHRCPFPLRVVLLAADGVRAIPVWAQSAASPEAVAAPAVDAGGSGFSANLGAVSLYKHRGQDQYSAAKERYARSAVQGGLDYAFANGFCIGNWNSSVRLYDADGKRADVEMDFYGGYKFSIGDVGWDLGVLRYQYPGISKLGTTELYAAASYKDLTLKYSHTVSKKYFGVEGADKRGSYGLHQQGQRGCWHEICF